MKRGALIVLVILILLVVAGIVWWKNGGKQKVKEEAMDRAPEIHLSSMNITDIDKNSIKMISETVLDNPLPFDLDIDSLYYELWIDSAKVVESTYPKNVVIRKSDSASLKLPVEVETRKMKQVIEKFERQKRDSADYSLKAKFRLKIPVAGKRSFDVDVTKRLPAIREITVEPGKIDIDKLGFKESEMDMNVHVKNNNVFDIRIKNGRYDVKVDDDLDLEGTMEKIVVIPAKGQETISMHMKVKTAKVPKLGWKLLARAKHTNFDMNFSGTILSDMEMINNSKMKMHASGTLQELKNLR